MCILEFLSPPGRDRHVPHVLSFCTLFLLFLSLTVPGGIAPESLTLTPLDDMIFLKWEEPVEPNGLITQYEVKYETGLFDYLYFI